MGNSDNEYVDFTFSATISKVLNVEIYFINKTVLKCDMFERDLMDMKIWLESNIKRGRSNEFKTFSMFDAECSKLTISKSDIMFVKSKDKEC